MTLLVRTALLVLLSYHSFSQNSGPELFRNRAALQMNPIGHLEHLYYNQPRAFEKLEFYFTQSFEATRLDCNCDADKNVLINQQVFFVQEFESLRKDTAQHTFLYKNEYEITLLSRNELNEAYANIDAATATDPIPEWADSGDDSADYATYKAALDDWITRNKSTFRSMLNAGMKRVNIDEFMIMSDTKRQQILNHPQGYFLHD